MFEKDIHIIFCSLKFEIFITNRKVLFLIKSILHAVSKIPRVRQRDAV